MGVSYELRDPDNATMAPSDKVKVSFYDLEKKKKMCRFILHDPFYSLQYPRYTS